MTYSPTRSFLTRGAIASVMLTAGVARGQVPASKWDASLSAFDGTRPIFVRMADQLLGPGEYDRMCAEHATSPRTVLRRRFRADLKSRAAASWKSIEVAIGELQKSEAITAPRRFWIINGFACDATAPAVAKLAALDAVGYVHLQTQPGRPQHRTRRRGAKWTADRKADQERALAMLEAAKETEFSAEGLRVPWNLKRIRADRAWQDGAAGQGVTIALLDTGALITPALVHAMWRNPREQPNGIDDDGNGLVDDLLGWDFGADTPYAVGDGPRSHGTMCGGILAGRPAGEPATVTGVAPRARLMVLRGTGSLRAYEYAADMNADVLSMSYMWIGRELGSYRGVFRTAHEHLAACGIVAVGGAGNFGRNAPAGRQIALPKDIPCVIAAAGVVESGEAPPFSSRGPCTWDRVPFFADYPAEDPLQKPDVTGCIGGFPVWHWIRGPRGRKVEVTLEVEGGMGLIVGPRGNSFSGPHAGGVAALMLSVNHELTPWRIKSLMERTCADLGPEGRDTTYGAGLLQADAAVKAARAAPID